MLYENNVIRFCKLIDNTDMIHLLSAIVHLSSTTCTSFIKPFLLHLYIAETLKGLHALIGQDNNKN